MTLFLGATQLHALTWLSSGSTPTIYNSPHLALLPALRTVHTYTKCGEPFKLSQSLGHVRTLLDIFEDMSPLSAQVHKGARLYNHDLALDNYTCNSEASMKECK